jgi:crotonobetainyl-CoA:carnitine CoA-transferase CaiB-like acyl-CoA transferase
VWDYAELFAEPQAAARGLRVTVRDAEGRPVDLVGTPFHIAGATLPAPLAPLRQGQDTDAVLRDVLGLDAEQVSALRERGIV